MVQLSLWGFLPQEREASLRQPLLRELLRPSILLLLLELPFSLLLVIRRLQPAVPAAPAARPHRPQEKRNAPQGGAVLSEGGWYSRPRSCIISGAPPIGTTMHLHVP